MAITTSINNNLGNGYVQMDISSKTMPVRHFILPEQNVDTFTKEYEKINKNIKISTYAAFFTGLVAGVFGAAYMMQNLVKNQFLRFIIGSASGVICSTIGIKCVGEHFNGKMSKIMKNNNAKEVEIKNQLQ